MIELAKFIYNHRTARKVDMSPVEVQSDARFTEQNEIVEDATVVQNNDVKGFTASKIANVLQAQGIVTTLNVEGGVIDNVLPFKMSMTSNLTLSIHQTVSYLYQNDEGQMRIHRIVDIVDQKRNDEPPTQEIYQVDETRPEVYTGPSIRKNGVIVSKRKDFIEVDADDENLHIFLDEIETSFTPDIGDLVSLLCELQANFDHDDINETTVIVKSLKPKRQKESLGTITFVEPNELGIVDQNSVFYWDALIPSQRVVNKGDKVNVERIECTPVEINRTTCNWRCIKVMLVEDADTCKTRKKNIKKNWNGITITDNHVVELTDINQTKKFTMIVKNTSDVARKVLHSIFIGTKEESQLTLISPTRNATFFLNPGEEKEYLFKAKSKFFGTSIEIFYVKFEEFKVERKIKIIVEDTKCLYPSVGTGRNVHKNYTYTKQVLMRDSRKAIYGVPLAKIPNVVKVKFEVFEVPRDLALIVLGSNTRSAINETLDAEYPCFQSPLNIENYTNVFHCLLWLEEIEIHHSMRKYDQSKAFFTRQDKYLALKVNHIAETRPSLVFGDSVIVSNPWSPSKENDYRGFIHKVMHDRVLIKFCDDFHSKYKNEYYKVEFEFSRTSLRKQHHAIDLAKKKLGAEFLFPNKITIVGKQVDVNLNNGQIYLSEKVIPWFNESLNIIQKQAVVNILQGVARPMPYVIFGPPGTGKTVTLIETILQLIKQVPYSRILVATPSNSSANLITERIVQSGILEQGDFMRLVGENSLEKEQIPENILCYCGTISIASDTTTKGQEKVTDSGIKINCASKYLAHRRLLIGTCITLGTLMQCDFPEDHFTHVIVDESGQCMETELIIPISFADRTLGQIILAGDPMQLGPIVLSHFAGKRGLSQSFLARILNRFPYTVDRERFEQGFDPRLVTKLLYNYRSLPTVMKVYSELFYQDDLRAMISDVDSAESETLKNLAKILPPGRDLTQGVIFVGVEGKSEQCSDSPSWLNKAEANSVFRFLTNLYKMGYKSEDIGIITPYVLQVKSIRSLVKEADMLVPKVGTVEEFQGQERQIILLSTVRSVTHQLKTDATYALGFVKSPKRMNVAISRARALLVIFGSPKILSQDENWRSLIQKCMKNKCAVNCDPAMLKMEQRTSDDDE